MTSCSDMEIQGEIVRFNGRYGEFDAVCVWRGGNIGVIRAHDYLYWRITDMRSGIAVPYDFEDHECAMGAAQEIAAVIDWNPFVDALAKGEKPRQDISTTQRICESWTREYTGGNEGSAQELADRLS